MTTQLPTGDWLSRLLKIVPVAGRLDLRCHYSAPWQLVDDITSSEVMRYHVLLQGEAVLDMPERGSSMALKAGDIAILIGGQRHILHDGSGLPAHRAFNKLGDTHLMSEIPGSAEPLDMICGRLEVPHPHGSILQRYFPTLIVVNVSLASGSAGSDTTGTPLSSLVSLMRGEADQARVGSIAMLNAYSTALFTLALRLAIGPSTDTKGLLAVAGNPTLRPALHAMIETPSRAWTLPDLASLCNTSRATFVRRFQASLGRSASDFLTDLRMSLAANELRKPGASTGAVAEVVGYHSEAAFQRAFKVRFGVTPSRWRKAGQPATGG